jgi:mono/diheme cytochrome c family protein
MSDLSPERINLQEKDKHYADTSWRDQMDWRGFVFEFGNSSAFKGAALKRPDSPDTQQIERGRYLVKITGCNDCHTSGYTQKGGKVPEKEWLTGDRLGWRGPWETTYAGNLRTYMDAISESQWIQVAHTAEFRPPMPWFALHDMTEQDLRAMYRFVKRLGPAGGPVPSYLPPDQEPKGPYVLFPQPPK